MRRLGALLVIPLLLLGCTGGGTPKPAQIVPTKPAVGGLPSTGDIAFVSDRGGTKQLWMMAADGSGAIPVTASPRDPYWPAFTKDGTRVAYAQIPVNPVSDDLDVFVLDANGAVQLTYGPARDTSPSWSPDGSEIAFATSAAGPPRIAVVRVADGAVTTLSPADEAAFQPTFSPDGSRIAFAVRDSSCSLTDETCPQHIWLMDASSGGNPVELTHGKEHDGEPAWSPDGTTIVFTSNRGDSSNFDVWTMAADGSDASRLTRAAGLDLNPHWSPDGSQIAFSTQRDGDFEIYLMHADGRGQTDISNAHGSQDYTPTWR